MGEKTGLPVLAIDLGGTKIASAIVSPEGRVLARDYRLTLADEGVEPVIARILSAVEHLLKKGAVSLSQLDSISIASAGAIDSERGLVTASPNLPGWHNVPLRDIVGERFGVSTFLVNDARAAAGPQCYCGNSGCLEVLASGRAIAREAIRRIGAGESSALTGIVSGKVDSITAREVSQAAEAGDPLALGVVSRAAMYLGVGMVNVVNIFNPEMIVFGGSVAKMGDLLLDPVRQLVKDGAFGLSAQAVSIVPASLGDDVGVLGAACFALEPKAG